MVYKNLAIFTTTLNYPERSHFITTETQSASISYSWDQDPGHLPLYLFILKFLKIVSFFYK